MRKVVDHYFRGTERMAGYSYQRRIERLEFDDKGQTKSRRLFTVQSGFVDGVRVSYEIERDDKPLPPEDLKRAQTLAKESVAKWKALPPEERRRTEEKRRKDRRTEADYLTEFPDGLEFYPAGSETVNGREALVYRFEPRPGYKPKAIEGRVYEKVRGRILIDKQELHMVSMAGEVYDNVSIGGILGRVEKGTKFDIRQTRIGADEWLPSTQLYRFDLRILIVKSVRQQFDSRYLNYQRHPGAPWKAD